MCQTNRNFRRPDTFSSHSSSISHNFGTGRHTTRSCAGVSKSMSIGGVVDRRWCSKYRSPVACSGYGLWCRQASVNIQGAVLRFRPKDIHFWIDLLPLGSFVGFSQYTANFYICIYLLYVTWTTCFGLSYFRPSSGPSIALLFAVPGVMWLFS